MQNASAAKHSFFDKAVGTVREIRTSSAAELMKRLTEMKKADRKKYYLGDEIMFFFFFL